MAIHLRQRAWSFFLFAAMLLVISSCGNKSGAPAAGGPPPAVEVDAIIMKEDSFSREVEAAGTLLANEFVELKSEINGRIVQLNIPEGGNVASGALLVKLYDEDLQAQLKKYQAQLELAEKNRDRLKKLLDASGVSQQEYDQSLATVAGLQADVAYTQAQIRKTEVRAPFSGVVGLRNVSMGAMVSPTQTLVTIQDLGTTKVDFVLPEMESRNVHAGTSVRVKGDAGEWRATVIAEEPQINSGTRNVKFRARLDGSEHPNPGAFVSVLVPRNTSPKALLLPTNAIIMESRNKKVATIKGGKVKFQVVETGFRGEQSAEIVSGLSVGDTVAISGLLFLKPDVAVSFKSIH